MTSYSTLVLGDIMMHQIKKKRVDGRQVFELLRTDEPIDMAPGVRALLTERLARPLAAVRLRRSRIRSLGPKRRRSFGRFGATPASWLT